VSPTGTSAVIVVGGGVLGATTAYHLARRGARVTVMDLGPGGFNATAGNHGLVWAQDKASSPCLGLTLRSIGLYPDFSRELGDLTGVDIEYERPGGLSLSLSEAELAARGLYHGAGAGSRLRSRDAGRPGASCAGAPGRAGGGRRRLGSGRVGERRPQAEWLPRFDRSRFRAEDPAAIEPAPAGLSLE